MRHQIRYAFEHRLLPSRFFEDKERFLIYLTGGRETIFQTQVAAFLAEKEPCPYQLEDYQVDFFGLKEDYFVIRLGFPKPEEMTDCYAAYLIFEKNFQHQAYFTVEKSIDDTFILGEWSVENHHHHHGQVQLEDEEIYRLCQAKFFDRIHAED